ncbi:MAG: GNAT family N-acetyltransferase [Sneathiella sp.]|nr:GNAT family N-acetyltransferase [Sneathiella sp.]
MDNHILDRPIWNSLTTIHARFAMGDDRARRLRDGVGIFAATKDDSRESLNSLERLMPEGGKLFFIQVPPVVVPDGLRVVQSGQGEQMLLEKLTAKAGTDHVVERLGAGDADAMLELATLTKPGPYFRDTRLLGEFWGVKEDGKLIAMTGERFRHPGYTEVSGVCTHPDHLGRGLAHALCVKVAEQIIARGETPYLQVYSANTRAIRVYENLGFRTRKQVHAVMLERV